MIALAFFASAAVAPLILSGTPLADPVLEDQRGGFRLPSGIEVALAADTQTSVDGAVVLRSVYAIDEGPASLTVFAPSSGAVTVDSGGRIQTVRFDRSDISVVQFAGGVFGSLITNTGSERTIDTVTTLSIDLSKAGPDVIGSTMFQVENLALDAVAARGGL